MSEEQEYLHNSDYVKIVKKYDDGDEMVIVKNDYGELFVATRSNLIRKEDSYQYKRAQERADELRLIIQKTEENFEAITEKVIKAACSTLTTRMKMNILFGQGMNGGGWAVTVADELNKLVREKAPETIKDKKDPFA